MRVFVEGGGLQHLYALSNRKHELVSRPEQAEIILVKLNWAANTEIEDHELAKQFPEKCFAISVSDTPRYTIHGIYVSAHGLLPKLGNRVAAGGYLLHMSPVISQELPGASAHCTKEFLFSFIGRNCHSVREAIFNMQFQREDVVVEDSSMSFALWDKNQDESVILHGQKRFCDVLKKSKFALCPRGIGPSSIRLFEALKLGVAPVIISDGWQLPVGPNWSEFCVFIKEKHVAELEYVLSECESDHIVMGARAAEVYNRWFCENVYFNYLVDRCEDISSRQWISEKAVRNFIRLGYSANTIVKRARKQMGIRARIKKAFRI